MKVKEEGLEASAEPVPFGSTDDPDQHDCDNPGDKVKNLFVISIIVSLKQKRFYFLYVVVRM